MSVSTPRKSGKADVRPLMDICNRCLLRLNDDLAGNPCDGIPGPLGKKCSRCNQGRHRCVWTDRPIIPALNKAFRARAALAQSLLDDSEEEQGVKRAAATTAGEDAIRDLRRFDKNRGVTSSDRTGKRKAGAGSAPASLGLDLQLAELQSIRRGLHALVEASKVGLTVLGASPARISRIDRIMGEDAVVSSEGEEEDEEDGGPASGEEGNTMEE